MGAAETGDAVNVFVTGGTGLVGSHVIAALRARGDRVTALARTAAAAARLAEAGAEPLAGSLGDAAALDAAARRADAIVHAAALVLSHRDWNAWHATNVAGTELVAEAAARRGIRLVHLSSVAVYGRRLTYDGGPGSVSEDFGLDAPASPHDSYVRSKREAELALWRIARATRLKAVALRPCVLYGEGDRHFSPRVAWVLRRGAAPYLGRGGNRLSVVYAGNVAAAVLAALDRGDATGPFNVTNDGEVTQREFLERFARGLGVAARMLSVPAGAAAGVARVWDAASRLLPRRARPMSLSQAAAWLVSENPYTSARARTELGWRPVVSAPEAVERTGRSFRTHP